MKKIMVKIFRKLCAFVPLCLCAFSRSSVPSSQSGVALIMVLGLLTVMVILAVAFAVSMRTERLASGNAADTVRARELVHVGLARALTNLAYILGTNGMASQGLPQVYPNWVVAPSADVYTNRSENLYLVYATNDSTRANEATNYIPRAIWETVTNADYIAASNQWVLITNSLDGTIMGRVKYLILNCSGLLDANYAGRVGGGLTRDGSTSPADIAIGNLVEIGNPPDNFIIARDGPPAPGAVRFETLAHLNSAGGLDNPPSSNLFVYSRARPGYYWSTVWNCVATQVNLAGGRAEVGGRSAQIFEALAAIGIEDPERGIIFRNLLDYVDPGLVPEDYNTSVEPVPMANEIVFSNTVTYLAGPPPVWRANCGATFELWYPFAHGGSSFRFAATVSFTPTAAGLSSLPCIVTNYSFLGSTTNRFVLIPCVGAPTDYPSDPVSFNIRIDNCMVYNGAEIYDRLMPGTVFSGVNPGAPKAMECLDPRLNYNPLFAGGMWREEAILNITLNNVNLWTDQYLASPTHSGDTDTSMYVANTNLQSVAELGYLVYSSNAWHTVKLYGGTNLNRVLDVFGLSTNVNDVYMTNAADCHGLVNCNPNVAVDATAAIFAGMPVDQYPGEGGNTLLMPEAQAFVSRLFTRGICTNLSDIGYKLNEADFTFPAGLNELQREAYFRNAIGLINLRQSVFTIIVEAQAASGGNIPRNPARQRVVAIVWRDPYTGEMFVRHIKWLSD